MAIAQHYKPSRMRDRVADVSQRALVFVYQCVPCNAPHGKPNQNTPIRARQMRRLCHPATKQRSRTLSIVLFAIFDLSSTAARMPSGSRARQYSRALENIASSVPARTCRSQSGAPQAGKRAE